SPTRLMRIWKNVPGIQHTDGGHRIVAGHPLRLSMEAFILRHYIVLSNEHANRKYSHRRFAPEDLAKGWHGNRLNVPSFVTLPDVPELHTLATCDCKAFSKAHPRKAHFWEEGWGKELCLLPASDSTCR